MNWTKIMECVPNFSEGRDLQKIDEIVSPFRAKAGVKLLDYSNDEDHNRLVVTVVGEPDALKEAVIEAIGIAVELIDLNHHQGQHPRMGAVDVVPFIPIKECTMEDAIAVSKEVGQRVASQYNLPVFLYEKSASAPHRENLAVIRKGEFEGMKEKIHQPEWHPDFGPAERHPTAGTVAIGARMPLVAYNINLNTPSLEIAHDIAKKIRFIGGGLRYCKAMGVELKDRGITQVSMNLTDYSKTAIYRAFEMVRFEAKRYGVSIIGSEIVKEAIINNSDVVMLLDQSKFKERFDTIKTILGLTDVDCKKIFTINRLENKEGRSFFREVFIRRGTTSGVYGVEEPRECYMTYTTERAEKEALKLYKRELQCSHQEAIEAYCRDWNTSGIGKALPFAQKVNEAGCVLNLTTKITS